MLDAAAVENLIHQGLPAAAEQGLRVEMVEQNQARLRFPFRSNSLRPGGTVSGPTIMGAADAAMYAAILGNLGAMEMAVTQQLNIHFLRRPAPRDLLAVARIIRAGRRTVVLEAQVYSDGSDEPVALVTGSYALPG